MSQCGLSSLLKHLSCIPWAWQNNRVFLPYNPVSQSIYSDFKDLFLMVVMWTKLK